MSTMLALGPVVESSAALRDLDLRFIAPQGTPVEGYRAYLTEIATGRESVFDLGYLEPDAENLILRAIPVDGDRSYVVQLTAYNDVGESGRSNRILLEVAGCDVDRDGLANRCDCDYDQDGSCTAGDFYEIFLPCFASSAAGFCAVANHNCDGSGSVDADDFFVGFLPGFESGEPCT